jgi:hypothetical protein
MLGELELAAFNKCKQCTYATWGAQNKKSDVVNISIKSDCIQDIGMHLAM